jgi:putative ABC transport system permease protein
MGRSRVSQGLGVRVAIMKLAWQNITHDRSRFLVTVAGVSFAAFLMVFQGSLLAGFMRAASRLIDSSDFDIWITARGVQAFEFGANLDDHVRQMAAGVPGVTETGRACIAFAVYRKPNGKQQVVALVGADRNVGARFPLPRVDGAVERASPDAVAFDASDREVIEVSSLPQEVEINRQRAKMEQEIQGYGGFLGVPSLFTSYQNAVRYLGFGPNDGMYVLLRVDPQYSIRETQLKLQQKLPEVDVLTRDEFAHKSRVYWMMKTGAGGAILAAAVLGFLIGLVVVSQTMYANTMENIEEYATLKALGARGSFVARIVLVQALACGAAGSLIGVLAVVPAMQGAKSLISWIYTPWWLPALSLILSLLMCSLAAFSSIRTALMVEPARVFRA